jgi:hypothetical protein
MMVKLLQTALLIFITNHSLQAQLGTGITGNSSIGTGSLGTPAIGKAATQNCLTPGSCGRVRTVYTFKGAGNWNIEGNWAGNAIPPALLPGRSRIVINPAGKAECILNIPMQIIPPGTSITVMYGKRFRVSGNLVKQ